MNAHFSQVFGTLSLNNSKMSLGSVSRGNYGEFSKGAYRPAGLLSTEMSKNVLVLTMVTAYGQLSCHTEDDSALASVLGGCLAWAAEPTVTPTAASTSAVAQTLQNPLGPFDVVAAHTDINRNGDGLFDMVVFSYGPATDRTVIKADHVRITHPEDPHRSVWTFAGNVVISRDGQSFSVAGLKFKSLGFISLGKGGSFEIRVSPVLISPSGQ
jgi:hypothetical protein